jgi:hypothetical protein
LSVSGRQALTLATVGLASDGLPPAPSGPDTAHLHELAAGIAVVRVASASDLPEDGSDVSLLSGEEVVKTYAVLARSELSAADAARLLADDLPGRARLLLLASTADGDVVVVTAG